MANPCDPDNAGFHSSPGSDRTRIQKWRFASASAQALSMVSAIAFASRALYRPRPEAGAHSFAESELDVFSSFEKLRNAEIAQTVASQFLRHRQLDPDRRDGGTMAQTSFTKDLRGRPVPQHAERIGFSARHRHLIPGCDM